MDEVYPNVFIGNFKGAKVKHNMARICEYDISVKIIEL